MTIIWYEVALCDDGTGINQVVIKDYLDSLISISPQYNKYLHNHHLKTFHQTQQRRSLILLIRRLTQTKSEIDCQQSQLFVLK